MSSSPVFFLINKKRAMIIQDTKILKVFMGFFISNEKLKIKHDELFYIQIKK